MVSVGDNLYKIVYPDYQNSILNITTSILKYYGISSKYSTNKILDEELKKKYRNVVYILVDAMGSEILKRHHQVSTELNKDCVADITSVFPPTTVAATTTVLTGLPPVTTGWLGWCQYVKEVDRSVVFYLNRDYYDEKTLFKEDISAQAAPVKKIYEMIEEINPSVKTMEIFPAFSQPHHDTFMKECITIFSACEEEGEHFIYAYWDKLDTVMHDKGPGSIEVNKMLATVEEGYIYLKENLGEDTIIIMIADHGQVGVCPIELRRYADLWATFIHEPSIESRAATFFIQKEKKFEFEQLFLKYFREYFLLFTKEEVKALGLFGEGEEHPKFDEFVGDYLAIAIDHYYFKLSEGTYFMKGQHAGLLEEEVMVPLIIHSKK